MKWDEIHGPSGVSSLVVPISEESLYQWRKWLSDQELDRLNKYAIPKRRQEFIAGRAAARHLLARNLSCTPAEVPLRIAASGAVLVDKNPWHLSIAHSGAWAVAVCAEGRVGVDLEEIVARKQNVQRFLLHKEERKLLASKLTSASITRLWVAKEAVLKARQTGLRMLASRLRMHGSIAQENPMIIEEPDGSRWQVWQGEFAGYPWAIAVPE